MKNREQISSRLLNGTREWPTSWARGPEDIQLGNNILEAMLPFLEAIVAEGRSETTLRRHFGNLWLLGGQIIENKGSSPSERQESGSDIVLKFIDYVGGPLLDNHNEEEAQRSFDSSCKKLYLFLIHPPIKRN
jgi:hypothetical protein